MSGRALPPTAPAHHAELRRAALHELAALLAAKGVCHSHGIDHARAVAAHACRATAELGPRLTPDEAAAVELAAVLHDADDRKFWPENADHENARAVLRAAGRPDLEPLVVEMISYVSASANRSEIPPACVAAPWKLLPRHCDRLEAFGWVGYLRCLEYTHTVGRPLWTPETARAADEADLWARVAAPARYAAYRGNSVSMVDHYYDKLLHFTAAYRADVACLDAEAELRRRVIVDVCLAFGRDGALDAEALAARAEKEAAAEACRAGAWPPGLEPL